MTLGEGGAAPWISLPDDLDRHNFERVPAGTSFGKTNHSMPVEVVDEDGQNVASAFFRIEHGEAQLTRALVPAMLTLQERIIRQDCLCYLMEEWRPTI